jgi:hypothetical protein
MVGMFFGRDARPDAVLTTICCSVSVGCFPTSPSDSLLVTM